MVRLSPLRNVHARAFLSFSAIHAMQMLLPLLAFPWLGRKLGAESFGLLMYMSIIPPIVCLFMEWGLTLGGARMAAKAREDKIFLGRLFGDIISAKIILCFFVIAAGMAALPMVPHAASWPGGYFLAIALGIARGLTPLWFFQGRGQGLRALAICDVGASLTALALIIALIHSPAAWPLYFFIVAACKSIAYLHLSKTIWKDFGAKLDFSAGMAILRATRTLFASSLFMMIYTNGSTLLMGYFIPAAQMGVIVAVNKMLRALAGLINPFTQTIFPEICIMAGIKTAKARFILHYSLFCAIAAMACAALLIFFLAPWILGIALGPEYEKNASVLRIMIWTAPFIGANYVLGTQILVAFGKEKAQVIAQGIMAAASLPITILLCLYGRITGAACVPLCIESSLFTGYILAVKLYCPTALFRR